MRKLAAEVLGTFAVVFVGTGAIVINEVSGGAVSHVGVALTFGLIVLAMIYAVGDVSGCHLNPAVTLGFFLSRRFEGRMVVPYIASQVRRGNRSPALVLRLHVPGQRRRSARRCLPVIALQSFVLEVRTDVHSDVRHPQRLDRLEGEGCPGGGRRGVGDRPGSAVRRADLRGVDEPGPLLRPGAGVTAARQLVGVPDGPFPGGVCRCPGVPLRSRARLLRSGRCAH